MSRARLASAAIPLLFAAAVRAQEPVTRGCVTVTYTTKEGTSVFYGGQDGSLRSFGRRLQDSALCSGFELVEGESAPDDCGVIVAAAAWRDGRTNFSPIAFTVEVYDRRSRRVLRSYSGRGGSGYSSAFPAAAELAGRACQDLSPGGSLHSYMAPSPTQSAPVTSGMDEEKLKRIVQAALADRQETAPAPRAASRSEVDRPRYKVAEDAQRFAIVMGVEGYSDLPAASHAERDARAMRAHLLALGYPERNVVSLVGDKATKTGLLKNLETWLPRNVGPASTVFFYFSGHGAPDPASGDAYLLPWDGDPQFLADTAYPLKRLYAKLSELKAARVIVALDACFSGAGGRSVLPKGARPLVGKVDTGYRPGKVASLTASAAHQISGSLDEQGHGAFTYYLLDGLNGAAKDASGRVTLRSLHGYLSPRVSDAARRQNRDQTPQLLGGEGADLVLR